MMCSSAIFIILVVLAVCGHVGVLADLRPPQQWRTGRDLTETREPWIELLSWSPRTFLYHNFLSPEEADHIVAEAKPFMMRSTVVGSDGGSVMDPIRTSYGTFLARYETPMIGAIQERVAQWTKLNVSHQEDMQVLRYGIGQKYGAHYDSLGDDTPRVATVLLYLRDVEEGGETAFPMDSEWLDESLPKRMGPFSECTKGSVAVKPKKGDALLFYSLKVDGTMDGASLHTGCPVIKGVKWTSTIWIHPAKFRPSMLGQPIRNSNVVPEECEDHEGLCVEWAAAGECKLNPSFMVGNSFTLGSCRLSCGQCEKCVPGDDECRSRNRVNAGFLSLAQLHEE